MTGIADPTAIAVQVALSLRAGIYSGEFPAGSELPSRRALAEKYSRQIGRQLSEATMNRALVLLARERLISMGSGRNTVVCPLDDYLVLIGIEGPRDVPDIRPYADALAALVAAEAAASGGELHIDKDEWTWSVDIRAANAALAGLIGLSIASRAAAAPGAVTWDFAKATVTAEPLRPGPSWVERELGI